MFKYHLVYEILSKLYRYNYEPLIYSLNISSITKRFLTNISIVRYTLTVLNSISSLTFGASFYDRCIKSLPFSTLRQQSLVETRFQKGI